MITDEVHPQTKMGFRLSDHPWISLVALWVVGILVLLLVAVVASLVGVPGEAPYRPLITPTLAHILVLFWITPFVLQLPNRKTTFRKYLDDIRLSHARPFLPLLILSISSSLILLLLLSVNSFVYRLAQGAPINAAFLRNAIDLRADLPPHSFGWIVSFPAIFEEVSWRGVMLIVFMKKYTVKKSILITALGFGLFHFLNLLGGVEADFVIRQVIFGSFLGLFYGYLVLQTDSLMPAMLFHYLVNLFIGSFTHYFQANASAVTQILYTLVNLPVATTILIYWVKIFCARWLPKIDYQKPNLMWRKQP